MSKFQEYLKKFDLTAQVTDEELAKTQALLRLYAPVMRQAARNLDEFEEECYEMRSQSITDFINLAIDYDNDADRKRIAGRLASMGHSMQLLSLLEETLLLVKNDPAYPYAARWYVLRRHHQSRRGKISVRLSLDSEGAASPA